MKRRVVIPLVLMLLCSVVLVRLALMVSDKRKIVTQALRESATQTLPAVALRDGDLVFQTSRSAQSQAIQLATKSTYSHCGVLFRKDGNFYVFEAVQPVRATPLQDWIVRGKGGHFVVKRLKNSSLLTPVAVQKMKQEATAFVGKDYDLTFEWSDQKLYCSELIWKIYKRGAGVEIGSLQTLQEFDLSSDAVIKIMKKRYGNNIPRNETVISPAAMFESPVLTTVYSN